MSRGDIEEAQFMIRTIERAKTHYEVFQLPDDADAKTIRTTMRVVQRRTRFNGRRDSVREMPLETRAVDATFSTHRRHAAQDSSG